MYVFSNHILDTATRSHPYFESILSCISHLSSLIFIFTTSCHRQEKKKEIPRYGCSHLKYEFLPSLLLAVGGQNDQPACLEL
jgi:hypothetical protein